MTGRTVVDDALVIEYGREEIATRDVTDAAVLRRRYVWRARPRIHADRIDAIVAGITTHRHHLRTVMIHESLEEVRRVMTGETVTACIVMDRRIRFTQGADRNISRTAVMARDAVIGNTGVTEYRRNKARNCMTAVTALTGRHVRERFDQVRPGRKKRADMTTLATSGISLVHRVEERGRRKRGRRIVAHTAIILRRNMNISSRGAGLTGRDTAAVAGRAVIAVDARVVVGDTRKGREVAGIMAR